MESLEGNTKKRDVIYDLETNGLLPEVSLIWICVAQDLNTGEQFIFSDHDSDARPLSELPSFLDSCRLLGAHNGHMYDLLVLEKILKWKPKPHHKLIDTLVMSQVQNYKRFGFGHSLAKWGDFFKFPKVAHEDWSQYSPEMRNRCTVDVKLNVMVYEYLVKELKSRKDPALLGLGLKVEHGVSRFVGRSILHGWPFDLVKAKEVLAKLEQEMEEIKGLVEPRLKKKVKQLDKEPEYKAPAYIKTGAYAARTASWFGVDPKRGDEDDRPVWGEYCRVEHVQPDIGSMEATKDLLYELGWEPDEWNYVKNDKGQLVKSTPKLTEASLEPLGPIAEAISNFYTLRARHSILTGWVDAVQEDGRLHGDCFVIGTPTGRSRHEVIANIPAAHTSYGPEIRSLFTVPPGYVMIGADSKGNQNRALAHYLNNPEYTEAIISGDIHTFNMNILESIVGSMGEDRKKARDKAKKFFYALIFAGGAGKLALIVTGRRDAAVGNKIKSEFLRKIPGLSELVTRLEKYFTATLNKTGKGYILALDTRPIYAEADRLVLNYALQSFEKITVAAAIEQLQRELDEGGFDWQPLIVYHDEVEFYVREEQAEAAKEIALRAFKEAAYQFDVHIMEGDAKIGKDWFDVH